MVDAARVGAQPKFLDSAPWDRVSFFIMGYEAAMSSMDKHESWEPSKNATSQANEVLRHFQRRLFRLYRPLKRAFHDLLQHWLWEYDLAKVWCPHVPVEHVQSLRDTGNMPHAIAFFS